MKSKIACLLVLAVAAQAQYFGYGLGAGYGGYYGGYYPYAGVRATTAYTGIPETAAVPAAYPVDYGSSYTATQYHTGDNLGQASFGYAHPGQAASNFRDGFGNQIDSYAYINPEGEEVRVTFTADSRGFRVPSKNLSVAPVANFLAPVQVQDTPKVIRSAPVAHAVALPGQDTLESSASKDAAAKAGRAKRQVFGFGAAPFAYPGYAVSPYAYSVAAPATPVREATLTKVIHTPGHAVSYRFD